MYMFCLWLLAHGSWCSGTAWRAGEGSQGTARLHTVRCLVLKITVHAMRRCQQDALALNSTQPQNDGKGKQGEGGGGGGYTGGALKKWRIATPPGKKK
jgi:hypothetical protein